MKRRFYDAKRGTFLYLTIHSPGLYLYHEKPLAAKLLKALAIHEAPLTAATPAPEPLAFGKPQAYKGEFRSSRA